MAKPALPTLLDVARAAGVSRTTASNAFNRPDQLSGELRAKVRAVAQAMGYPGPHPMARMLRTGRAGAIGVVFPDELVHAVSDPAASAMLQGIAAGCDAAEAALLLLSAVDQAAAQRAVAQAAVDGFIIHCLAAERAVIDSVLERGLPVVTIDNSAVVDAPSVTIAERAGAQLAAEHLLRLGHRRFAILALETQPDNYAGPLDAARRRDIMYLGTRLRLEGYEAALAAAGIDLGSVPVEESFCYRPEAAMAATARLLTGPDRPTALLAMSDLLALAAIAQARLLGLRVPDDLSVVGFDDIPLAGLQQPPLTTIRQPLVEKGRIAAELLLGERAKAQSVVLPTELVIRGTTAPPQA